MLKQHTLRSCTEAFPEVENTINIGGIAEGADGPPGPPLAMPVIHNSTI